MGGAETSRPISDCDEVDDKMTKLEAIATVQRIEKDIKEDEARYQEQVCLVDYLESGGEECEAEKEDLRYLHDELEKMRSQLEAAIDLSNSLS